MAWKPPERPVLTVRLESTLPFTPKQIAWASMLASPIAGGWLLRSNFVKFGHPIAGWVWFVAISAVVGGVCWLAYFMQPIPGPAFLLGYFFGMLGLAEVLQGATVRAHQERGGAVASLWKVVTPTVIWGSLLLLWLLWFLRAFPPILE